MGDDSRDPGAGAVADHPTGYRGECHGCRRDVAAVDCATEDPVHVIKYDEDSDLRSKFGRRKFLTNGLLSPFLIKRKDFGCG